MSLWCCRGLERYSRLRVLAHSWQNDWTWYHERPYLQSLVFGRSPSAEEPAGFLRSDDARPDGLMLIRWKNGIPVTCDVTVTHPLADFYLNKVSLTAGDCKQEVRRICCHIYQLLIPANRFRNSRCTQLHGDRLFIRVRLQARTNIGQAQRAFFFFKLLSICLQRFNAIAFNGTLFS